MVGVLAAVGVGVGLVLALWPTSAQAKPSPEDKPEAPPEQLPELPPEKSIVPKDTALPGLLGAGAGLLGPGTAGVLGGGAAAAAVGVAASAATLAAGAGLGFALTGDALGAVGGGVGTGLQMLAVGGGFTPITGQAGNVGRILGKEIDRLLNGTGLPGVSGSRVALEAAGFAAGLATVSLGITIVPFVGQTFALVVVLASAIQDAERVRYGQAGLVRDASAEAIAFQRTTVEILTRRVMEALGVGGDWQQALGPDDQRRVAAIAIAQATGFAEEANATRERAWLRRPHGIGVDDAGHVKWGLARGLYLTPENLDAVRATLRGLLENADPQKVLNGQEWDEARARGARSANFRHFLQAMAEPFDAFASADAHAVKWGRLGAFTGPTDTNGNLVDGFILVDWRKSLVGKSVVVVDNTPANTGPLPPPPAGAPPAPGNLGTSNLSPPGLSSGSTGAPKPPGGFSIPATVPPPTPLQTALSLGTPVFVPLVTKGKA